MKWLNKEGDKVSPWSVIWNWNGPCTIYWLKSKSWLKLSIFLTYIWYSKDKATFRLKCKEACYLAKIIQGNGSKKSWSWWGIEFIMQQCCNSSADLLSFLCLCVFAVFRMKAWSVEKSKYIVAMAPYTAVLIIFISFFFFFFSQIKRQLMWSFVLNIGNVLMLLYMWLL